MQARHGIDGDGIAFHQGGTADLPWWSFTKLVLAVAALRLVEQGRLDLDAPVAGEAYTLRQLLRHEAGLPDYARLAEYHHAVARGDLVWPQHEIVARTLAEHPPMPPGSAWAYSNIGYYEVGRLVSAAAGTTLAEALTGLALAPAGLERARLACTPTDLVGVEIGGAGGYDPGWVLHGLLVGPLGDAAQFLHRLLSGALLGPAMLGEMFRVRPLPQFRSALWEHPAYGLGLMGGWDGQGSPSGHSGEGPGSAIAVYGRVRHGRALVGAAWQSDATGQQVEALALETLGAL